MFDTGRTILRPYKESDLSHLVDLANDDPEVQSTLMFSGYPNLRYESMREFAQATSKEHFMGLAWDKETGEFVGWITLRTPSARNRIGKFGIALRKDWRGKGLGTEILQWMTAYAFKVMGLHRVRLNVAATNSAGIAVYKKIGFRVEGVAKESLWHYGRWIDVLQMAILEQEWNMETGSIREVQHVA